MCRLMRRKVAICRLYAVKLRVNIYNTLGGGYENKRDACHPAPSIECSTTPLLSLPPLPFVKAPLRPLFEMKVANI